MGASNPSTTIRDRWLRRGGRPAVLSRATGRTQLRGAPDGAATGPQRPPTRWSALLALPSSVQLRYEIPASAARSSARPAADDRAGRVSRRAPRCLDRERARRRRSCKLLRRRGRERRSSGWAAPRVLATRPHLASVFASGTLALPLARLPRRHESAGRTPSAAAGSCRTAKVDADRICSDLH